MDAHEYKDGNNGHWGKKSGEREGRGKKKLPIEYYYHILSNGFKRTPNLMRYTFVTHLHMCPDNLK